MRAIPWVGGAIVTIIMLLLLGWPGEPLLAPPVDFPGLVTGRYFDLQELALLSGHLDVPCDSLTWEAFILDGRCYGYFGLTPSFLRFFLNGLCPGCAGHWSRPMMLGGALLTYLCCLLVAERALAGLEDSRRRRLWATAFALVVCLGGSLPFIVSDPYAYHESILWSSAFALLAGWSLATYGQKREGWALWLALAAIFLTLHSRITVGLALAVAAMIWLIASRPRPRDVAASLALAVMVATPLAVNQLKFGQWVPPFNHQPWNYHFPERLALIQAGSFHLANLPCSLHLYLSPANIARMDGFPWVRPGQHAYWFTQTSLPAEAAVCAGTHIESLDPTFSLPYAAPAPLLLCAAGLIGLGVHWRRLGPIWGCPLAGALMAVGATMIYSSVTYRYVHDFFPLLVLGGALGWARLAGGGSARSRAVLLGLVGMLTVAAFDVNFSAALFSGSPQPAMLRLGNFLHGLIPG